MKVVIQRVKKSDVLIDDKESREIKQGLMVLVGFTNGDNLSDIDYIIKKIINLRIFDDEDGIMNKSILDINGEILSISQFTLYGCTKKGNRPSYTDALNAPESSILYDTFNERLSEYVKVKTGVFGSEMKVSLINDGPVTIIIDSKIK